MQVRTRADLTLHILMEHLFSAISAIGIVICCLVLDYWLAPASGAGRPAMKNSGKVNGIKKRLRALSSGVKVKMLGQIGRQSCRMIGQVTMIKYPMSEAHINYSVNVNKKLIPTLNKTSININIEWNGHIINAVI